MPGARSAGCARRGGGGGGGGAVCAAESEPPARVARGGQRGAAGGGRQGPSIAILVETVLSPLPPPASGFAALELVEPSGVYNLGGGKVPSLGLLHPFGREEAKPSLCCAAKH